MNFTIWKYWRAFLVWRRQSVTTAWYSPSVVSRDQWGCSVAFGAINTSGLFLYVRGTRSCIWGHLGMIIPPFNWTWCCRSNVMVGLFKPRGHQVGFRHLILSVDINMFLRGRLSNRRSYHDPTITWTHGLNNYFSFWSINLRISSFPEQLGLVSYVIPLSWYIAGWSATGLHFFF